ncbi:MAG: hypothetical protein ACMV0I_06945 [Pseudomonas sp.]
MQALAKFVMSGRKQATLTVAIAMALPMFFWVGAAVVALVMLRRGAGDASNVIALGALPAVLWFFFGDPQPLAALVGALSLAVVLRQTASWSKVLIFSLLLGVIAALLTNAAFGEFLQRMVSEISRLLPQVLGDVYTQLGNDERQHIEGLLRPVLVGLLAALLQMSCLLALLLARYWQSLLYNPGGLAAELQALRLSPVVALGLFAGIVVLPQIGGPLVMLTPLCSVPLAFAGIALVHGLAARSTWSGFLLIAFYAALLFFLQGVYPLLVMLAVIDSLLDFRGRLARSNSGGTTDR